MTDRRSSGDLGASAEALLGAFPFPERDWESDARAIELKFTESARGSTGAELLVAPLPSEPGEPAQVTATSTPLTSSGVRPQSLTDLARRSVERQRAEERAEMARETLALAAQQRPSAAQARALRDAVNSARNVEVPPTAIESGPARPTAPPRPISGRASRWPRVGLAAAGIALAAGAVLWLRQPAPAPLVSSVGVTEVAELPRGASEPAAHTRTDTGLVAAPAAAVPHEGIDPTTLSQEVPAKSAESAHAKALGASIPAVVGSGAGPAPQKVVLHDDRPNSPSAAAQPAEKPVDKALPPDPALRPADSTGEAIPVKPSTGAVQAALGTVMSGARHCVAGDDQPSSAVVVFGSDGRVQSVSVRGPAAGKPSGSCIEAQLSRARVQPFAAANFSISATVRPD